MARAHEIAIAADAKEFDQGIRSGVIEPLEDAEKALKDLGDSADDAGRDASRGIEKLEDKLKDAQRESKRLGDAGDKAADDVRRGMKRAEDGVEEFKDEAQSTAKEAAASFDGSFESIGDVAQEVAANAFAGFGPAGTAAGIAVAAGAGVMIDHIGKVGEAFDAARESAFEMAYGISGALETAGVQSRMAEWSGDTEKWKQVTDLAVGSGWDEIEVLTALAKGGDDLDRLTGAFVDHAAQTDQTTGRTRELEAVLKATSEGYMSASQATEVNSRALFEYAQKAGVATGETDDLGNAIYKLPDETEVAVNAKTKTATEDIARVDKAIDNVPDSHTTTFRGRAMLDGARRELANFRASEDGKTIRINARVVSSGTGWD